MDVADFMNKHHLSEEDLDRMAEPYERGDFPLEDGVVCNGSHLDAVAREEVTIYIDSSVTQQVRTLARSRGVDQADIYRAALDFYLAAQAG